MTDDVRVLGADQKKSGLWGRDCEAKYSDGRDVMDMRIALFSPVVTGTFENVKRAQVTDTAAKRTAHEKNTKLPVSVVFPVCNQNLLRKQKIPVARSLKPKLKSYETNLRVGIAHILGILLMNSYDFRYFNTQQFFAVCSLRISLVS